MSRRTLLYAVGVCLLVALVGAVVVAQLREQDRGERLEAATEIATGQARMEAMRAWEGEWAKVLPPDDRANLARIVANAGDERTRRAAELEARYGAGNLGLPDLDAGRAARAGLYAERARAMADRVSARAIADARGRYDLTAALGCLFRIEEEMKALREWFRTGDP